MSKSQNGWQALKTAPGGKLPWITGRVCLGDVYTVFDYLCTRFNAEVEPINKAHSWGWAYRPIRGSKALSNHASGTAIDLNAPKHPLGKSGTFTANQVKAIENILKDLQGAVRWGGHYSGRKDEMHFEIDVDVSKLSEIVASLGKKPSSMPQVAEKKSVYTGNSIVEYLKSVGKDSSYNARKKLAAKYGISGYTGSASQNLQLLAILRTGSAPTPAPVQKSISQMADEVIAGKHGNGHSNRQKSLGISRAEYEKVRAEVNSRNGVKPEGKSDLELAREVIAGKHGNGHMNRRKSLGVSNARYQKIRALVNKLA